MTEKQISAAEKSLTAEIFEEDPEEFEEIAQNSPPKNKPSSDLDENEAESSNFKKIVPKSGF